MVVFFHFGELIKFCTGHLQWIVIHKLDIILHWLILFTDILAYLISMEIDCVTIVFTCMNKCFPTFLLFIPLLSSLNTQPLTE